MSKQKILVQLDSDNHPSVFDSVTAIDAGVDQLLSHGRVEPMEISSLAPGAIFTRGPQDLHNTAIFIGGSDVRTGEQILEQVVDCFVGPMRVSVMLDPNGCNTTAAAAVLSAAKHLDLSKTEAIVLAATGPVGQRAVRLLARQGATVRVASRKLARAEAVCNEIKEKLPEAILIPLETLSLQDTEDALAGANLLIAAGAQGIELVSAEQLQAASSLQVAIDLNATPPLGINGVGMTDNAVEKDGKIYYGAIGVGGPKMKIHKAALKQLFTSNDQILDAEEIYDLGAALSK